MTGQCQRCDQPARNGGLCPACIEDENASHEMDDDADPEDLGFECAGYYPEPAGEFYCPLWGSEECDWECPYGGMG